MSTEARLTTLEHAMAELAHAQVRTTANLDRLSEEMRVFKDEMRASKKDADERWGELANKMGTLAEDIVAPSIPKVFQALFGVEDPDWYVRVRRRHRADRSRRVEFDVVAWGGQHFLSAAVVLHPELCRNAAVRQHVHHLGNRQSGGQRPSRCSACLELPGRPLPLQESSRGQDWKPVERVAQKSREVLSIQREQRVRPSERAEQDRAVLGRSEDAGPIDREDIILDDQAGPQSHPIRAGGQRKKMEVPQHLLHHVGCRDQRPVIPGR